MAKENLENILLITIRSDLGGGPRHVLDLAKGLKALNKFNLYIASPLDPPNGKELQELALKHIKLTHRRFSPIKLISLALFCIKNKIKVVHSHGRGAGLYSRPLKLLNIKVIHTNHGTHPPESFTEAIKLFVDKLLLINTDLQIFVSNSELESGKKLNAVGKKFQIIPNGISLNEIDPDKVFVKSCDSVALGTLTRKDPHKSNDLLIRHFCAFNKKYPQSTLHIAGIDKDDQHTQDLLVKYDVAEKVFLHGQIPDPLNFLRKLDCYVSCSRGEGLPYAAIEAMSEKIPIILSDVPGHQELADQDNLFERNSSEDFISKIENRSQNKVEENYLKVKEIYGIKTMIQKISHEYLT